MYQTIEYKQQDGIATITLNRPKRYNALIEQMNIEITKALKHIKRDESVRVVVMTGAGEKAFCSGQDLKAIGDAAGIRNLGDSVRKRFNPLITAMHDLPKPIICRLNGVAAGAGCSLALACDMIIAAEHAWFVEAFVNIGLVLDSGSSYFLPRIVGMKKAFELCTTGRKVDAQEAFELGLVNKVVSKEQLDEEVNKLAQHYAKAPTKAIGLIKKMLYKSSESDLAAMLEYEALYQDVAGRSQDYIEGVRSFVEKRKPEFKGN